MNIQHVIDELTEVISHAESCHRDWADRAGLTGVLYSEPDWIVKARIFLSALKERSMTPVDMDFGNAILPFHACPLTPKHLEGEWIVETWNHEQIGPTSLRATAVYDAQRMNNGYLLSRPALAAVVAAGGK